MKGLSPDAGRGADAGWKGLRGPYYVLRLRDFEGFLRLNISGSWTK